MRHMNRIEKGMHPAEIHLAISEAHVGASDLISELIDMYRLVEPNMKAVGVVYYLQLIDSLGLYGESLYDYWQTICHGRVEVLLAVLRFYQLGKLTKESVLNLTNHTSLTVLNRMADLDDNYKPFLSTKKILA